MDLLLPPTWLQSKTYPARLERMMLRNLFENSGVVATSHYAVTAQASPAMTVNVAGGKAWVASSGTNRGYYEVVNDNPVIVNIGTASASTRQDLVILRVYDAEYSGVFNEAQIEVLAGVPGGSEPAVPDNAIALARVTVNVGATGITNANILDRRPIAKFRDRLAPNFLEVIPFTQITSFADASVTGTAARTPPAYRIIGGNRVEVAGHLNIAQALAAGGVVPLFQLPISLVKKERFPVWVGRETNLSGNQSAGTSHKHNIQWGSGLGTVEVQNDGLFTFYAGGSFLSGENISIEGIFFDTKNG